MSVPYMEIAFIYVTFNSLEKVREVIFVNSR